MNVEKLKDWLWLRSYTGERTQFLVTLAFIFNLVCYADMTMDGTPTNFYKLLVQQLLILSIGTMGAKLDRLRK